MKYLSHVMLSLALLVCARAASAQDVKPAAQDHVVRISTNLVQIDVSVIDKKGRIVTDLRPEEIEIFENGKRQAISNFSFVSNPREKTEGAEAKPAKTQSALPPPTTLRPEGVRRTIALVVDDLTLSFASTFWVKEALRKFVNEQMLEGDLVALVRTSAGAGALQQFTNDKRLLMSAIQKIKFNMAASARPSAFDAIRPSLKELRAGTRDSQGNVREYNEDLARDRAFENEVNEFRENIFATGTLGALNYVIRGMDDLPGRKSIMLLSDGLRLNFRDERGVPQRSGVYDSLRRLIDLANRASVVFYTLDARGLVAPATSAADDVTEIFASVYETQKNARINEITDTQEGLRLLARETGGLAMINQNDLSGGIRRVLDDQSYYLVGYEPDDETFDPKTRRFNKIEVRVTRPDVRVRYRSGFFGYSEEQIRKTGASPVRSLMTAITSPFTTNQIDVRMNALFVADAQRKPSVVSFINIDPAGLTFVEAADGLRKTSVDIVAFTFGAQGNVIDERSKNITVTLTSAQYHALLKRGLVATFGLPVKNSGGYQVRLAVRDLASGRIGAASQFVDVPAVNDGKFALSGTILSNASASGVLSADAVSLDVEDPLRHTSVRQFKPGTPLEFHFFAYNPKLGADKMPRLGQSYRLYKDNEVIFASAERQVPLTGQPSLRALALSGGIMLGAELLPGDYVLELVVRDHLDKNRTATQFVQFEIVG